MTAYNKRGQVPGGIGGLIALLVIIAVGALVLYSVTKPLREAVTIPDTVVENNGSKNVDVNYGVETATITTDWSGMDNAGDSFEVHLNGENILVRSGSIADDAVENTVTGRISRGSNTLKIVKKEASDGTHFSVKSVLDVDTHGQTSVETVESKGSTVFDLLTILAIVFVAALIISVVIKSIGGYGGPTAR